MDAPLEKITVTCPSCREEVRVGVLHVGAAAICPKCRNVIHDTAPPPERDREKEFERPERKKTKAPVFEPAHGRVYRTIRIIIVFAVIWVVSAMTTYWKFRPEIHSVVEDLEKRFDETHIRVRSPLPFCISVHIQGKSNKGGIVGKIDTTRYYVCVFRFKREIPEKEAPRYMSWVWGDSTKERK